jgi:PAS domain S-box-containing protein
VDYALLESLPDAMVIADQAGTIVFANGLAERLFGWSRQELVGRPVELLLPLRHRTAHQIQRGAYQAAPRTRPMGLGLDLFGLRRDGSEFAAEISLSPVDVAGRPCVMAAVRDVTERKKLEERARLWQKAREEVRERDEFLSVAAHELRTPVTALQLHLQLLDRASRRDPTGQAAQLGEKLVTLERQSRRLARLVDELLDLSRLRLGRVELRYEQADLAALARETAEQLGEEVRLAGSVITLALTPAPGWYDRTRIGQIVMNLLVNAGKFGRGKPVRLRVWPEGPRARIEVSDEGIGIAKEHQARIFERFERAVPTRRFGGLGLGLYIVRQLAEAHGGRVELVSEEGQGTIFTVDLPRNPVAKAGAEAGRAER